MRGARGDCNGGAFPIVAATLIRISSWYYAVIGAPGEYVYGEFERVYLVGVSAGENVGQE